MEKHYPSASQTLTLILRQFFFYFLLFIPMIIVLLIRDDNLSDLDNNPVFVASLAVAVNVIIISYAIYRIRQQQPFSLISELKNMPSLMLIIFSILSVISLIILYDPLDQFIPESEIFKGQFEFIFQHKLITFLFVILLGPITEEILFRGIVLRGFLKNYAPIKAILLSATFFAVIHINPSQIGFAFLAGCFLGYIYWQTRSLTLTILLHMLNNAASVAYYYLGYESSLWEQIPSTPIYLTIYLLAAITMSISLMLIYKKGSGGIY